MREAALRIARKAQAGTMQSSDLMVAVEPAEALSVEIESTVKKQFEHLIRAVAERVLAAHGVTAGRIRLTDRGALDYAIQARLETALQRAAGG
jgi:citrate lyase subunit gamma (acyl carrier protein)